jgi:hypothetical protein
VPRLLRHERGHAQQQGERRDHGRRAKVDGPLAGRGQPVRGEHAGLALVQAGGAPPLLPGDRPQHVVPRRRVVVEQDALEPERAERDQRDEVQRQRDQHRRRGRAAHRELLDAVDQPAGVHGDHGAGEVAHGVARLVELGGGERAHQVRDEQRAGQHGAQEPHQVALHRHDGQRLPEVLEAVQRGLAVRAAGRRLVVQGTRELGDVARRVGRDDRLQERRGHEHRQAPQPAAVADRHPAGAQRIVGKAQDVAVPGQQIGQVRVQRGLGGHGDSCRSSQAVLAPSTMAALTVDPLALPS